MDYVISGIGTTCAYRKEYMCPYFTLFIEIKCNKIK